MKEVWAIFQTGVTNTKAEGAFVALLLQMVQKHLPCEVCYSGGGGGVGMCPTLKLLGVC